MLHDGQRGKGEPDQRLKPLRAVAGFSSLVAFLAAFVLDLTEDVRFELPLKP